MDFIDGVFVQRFVSELKNEGTAIFKCATEVPTGKSRFVPLGKEIPFSMTMPSRKLKK